MSRVGETDTAFANRDQAFLLGIEGNWEDHASSEANVAWVRETVDQMSEFSEGGTYLNFPGFLEDGDDTVRQGYGANYERLVEVKARYDPDNLFRLNANVVPAG
jgi:FAD/FMN-containing dehydrogenase